MNDFDPLTYRKALGQFATGVTIVTTRGPDGVPAGVTSNSFNTVSLSPPLILWSIAKTARSLSAFAVAPEFTVHILASDQANLASLFASRVEDKFSDLGLGHDGPPLIDGCVARLHCKTHARHEGGDHIIIIGEVERFDVNAKEPLLFHAGKFAERLHRAD